MYLYLPVVMYIGCNDVYFWMHNNHSKSVKNVDRKISSLVMVRVGG